MPDPRSTAGVSPRGFRRRRRHLLIGTGSVLSVALLALQFRGPLRERISLATAYVALIALAVTLSLGPINVLRSRPNPISFDLRRDFGIWSAVLGVAHTLIGLTVHFTGRMRLYFLAPPGERGFFGLRTDSFGAANHTGLIAIALLLLLATISNDLSLRALGTGRWRALQRWAYLLLALTIVHGALYQLLEKQRIMLVFVFLGVTATVITLQLSGRHRFVANQGRR